MTRSENLLSFSEYFVTMPYSSNSFHFLAAEEECRVLLYFKPMKGRTLLNHVMIRIDIPREDVCSIRCFLEPNCLSYNVGPLEHSNRYLCEISDSTDVRHPGDLVQRLGFTYQEIKVCSSVIHSLGSRLKCVLRSNLFFVLFTGKRNTK